MCNLNLIRDFREHDDQIDIDKDIVCAYYQSGKRRLMIQEPAKYEFSYEVKDEQSGADYGHTETRDGDRAQGEFNVLLPDGRKQIIEYEADQDGFKPQIRYEGEANNGGYGSGPNGNGGGDFGDNGYPSGGPNGNGNGGDGNGYPSGGPSGNGGGSDSGNGKTKRFLA